MTVADTVMAAAFRRAGVNSAENEWMAATSRYLNRGGTVERAYEMLAMIADRMGDHGHVAAAARVMRQHQIAAKEMPGEGHHADADIVGHRVAAPARQPNGDEAGQKAIADNGQNVGAPSSPPRSDAAGHVTSAISGGRPSSAPASDRPAGSRADHARKGHTRSAAGGRDPSPRRVAAMRKVHHMHAVSVLDTHRIRDGRAIGDVRLGELASLRGANLMEASLATLLMRHVANPEPDMKVRDAVNAETLQRMIQKSAEMADAF